MSCYTPLVAALSLDGDKIRFPAVSMSYGMALNLDYFLVPCNRCEGCLLRRSANKALLCSFEASLYESSVFLTLTYSDDNLPLTNKGLPTLKKLDLQLFFKKLRKFFNYKGQKPILAFDSIRSPIRYFACGEYGEKLGRPHYHVLLFNVDFDDKRLSHVSNGNNLYSSDILHSLWPHGAAFVGSDVGYEAASYVSRYCLKKRSNLFSKKDLFREVTDILKSQEDFNEKEFDSSKVNDFISNNLPIYEYDVSSNRPGIGAYWFYKNYKDLFKVGSIIRSTKNGSIRCGIPPAFIRLFKRDFPQCYDVLKQSRFEYARNKFREYLEKDPGYVDRQIEANALIRSQRVKGKLPRVYDECLIGEKVA